MSKRYVFWRTPAGRPYRGGDEKHAPLELLADIGTSATINKEGKPTWEAFGFHRLETAIRARFVVLSPNGVELNETDSWAIIWSAIRSVVQKSGGQSPIRLRAFIEKANASAASHFRTRPKEYVLVTSLSVKSFPATRLKVKNCEIVPLKRRGRRYPYPGVLRLQSRRTAFGRHVDTTEYQFVRVRTAERTIHEAAQRALEALDLLRGLWTLLATYGTWGMHWGSPEQKPLGVIHIGPVHTLHFPDGRLVGNTYWYQPHFAEDRKLFEPKKGWADIERYRRWATRRLHRLPFQQDIEDLIIRYVNALDHANLDVAFLQMWSILEKLTNTVGANYDETIRRAVWRFTDRRLAGEMLESLRLRRNQYVHAAKSPEDREQITYMVKDLVDPHLHDLIRNDFRVESLEEYAACLALPTDIKTLEKRQQQMRRAARMLKRQGNRS
ncbi:MAG TPA: hypothetical protein VMZ31_04430 [Phycisphaerae bacterium]|nr:hypothetical protein [Phycisphaerae bacterium]